MRIDRVDDGEARFVEIEMALDQRQQVLGRGFAGAEFVWVDIEDQADLVDPMEVDNFPTLLVVVDGAVRFFGSITPQTETLQRLVQAQLEAPAATTDPAVTALVQRLRR